MSAGRHPYSAQPDRAFWSRSMAETFDPMAVVTAAKPLLRRGDRIVSAGSCFASNLVPFLEEAGLTYVRTELMHPSFVQALSETFGPGRRSAFGGKVEPKPTLLHRALGRFRRPKIAQGNRPTAPDNFGYANFSAAYGNIYSARQLLQLIQRTTGHFSPSERYWVAGDEIVDPFRPGLRYRARTVSEFDALTYQHLERTREAFASADVVVLTLGLTEAWVSRDDGAVFPACPGTIAGTFDPARHVFKNFSAAEVADDLDAFIVTLRGFNPTCRFILTVSPVPLVATATDAHVLCATTYSKSVLRIAAQEAAVRRTEVTYFPAYELVTGPQAPKSYLAPDLRNVTTEAIETVMTTLLQHCETSRPTGSTTFHVEPPKTAPTALAAAILDAECEEMMSER